MPAPDRQRALSEALCLCGHLRPGRIREAMREDILARLAPLGGAVPVFFPCAPSSLCQSCLRAEIADRLSTRRTTPLAPVPANDNARLS